MEKFVVLAIGTLVYFLVILFGAWWLWTTVWTYFWPTGPQQLISPDFWVFLAGALLLQWLASFFKD